MRYVITRFLILGAEGVGKSFLVSCLSMDVLLKNMSEVKLKQGGAQGSAVIVM